MKENDFNLIEKYVRAAYGPQNRSRTNDVKKLQFLLFTKLSDNKLRKFSPTVITGYKCEYQNQVIKYHVQLNWDGIIQ